MAKLTGSCPHFLVKDLLASLDYYERALGFNRPPLWGEPPQFAMPQRDGLIVMLNQVDGLDPHPSGGGIWDAYFWCDDARALFEQFKANRAIIEHEPELRPLYGMCEIAVRDPDGYVLAFGSDEQEA